MLKLKVRVVLFALTVGVMAGVYSAQPVAAVGDDVCMSSIGCCDVTTTCGSPFEWRCCLPQSGEAPCGDETCPNYCNHATNCTIVPA